MLQRTYEPLRDLASDPAWSIAASEDHVVPPAAAFGIQRVWGGPVEARTVRGGHVRACIGKALPAALLDWVRA